MSIDQVDALLAATSEPFKAAIVIGAGLGLHQSEAAGLTVGRVDVINVGVFPWRCGPVDEATLVALIGDGPNDLAPSSPGFPVVPIPA